MYDSCTHLLSNGCAVYNTNCSLIVSQIVHAIMEFELLQNLQYYKLQKNANNNVGIDVSKWLSAIRLNFSISVSVTISLLHVGDTCSCKCQYTSVYDEIVTLMHEHDFLSF